MIESAATYTTSSTMTTTTTYTTAAEFEFENFELARLLHIDSDNEDEIANAKFYMKSAEMYLAGAGVAKDYSNGLYKHLVITLTARALERPNMLSNFADMAVNGLLPMIAQLRLTQALGGDV